MQLNNLLISKMVFRTVLVEGFLIWNKANWGRLSISLIKIGFFYVAVGGGLKLLVWFTLVQYFMEAWIYGRKNKMQKSIKYLFP